MTGPDLIFTICHRNDITLGGLADRAGIDPERVCLVVEARALLEQTERTRIADIGRRLKTQRESA